MQDEPFDEEKAYCGLQSLNSVVMALIATHPEPLKLAAQLRKEAEDTHACLLDTKNRDRTLENIRDQILRFAQFAEATAQKEP